MSIACAKPSCAEPARIWLDFAPAERRVIERVERGEATVGLCESHGERFGVPHGWSYERLSSVDDVPVLPKGESVEELASSEDSASKRPSPNRTNRRGHPWFLGADDTAAPDGGERTPAESDRAGAAHEPTAGSLLHRAFHGPDRDRDRDRAAHDELEGRRSARGDDCGTIALPFPPFGSEHQIAVS